MARPVAPPPGGGARIKVWDLPTRAFHWLIVVLVLAAWWTAQDSQMRWHRLIGYAIAALLAFRIWWGFAGADTARFATFVRGPGAVLQYARTLIRRGALPGHNPMGGWSVLALLGALLGEVALGLFSVDVDGVESGPLADRVSFDVGRLAAHWHHLVFNALLALIALHLCAVAFYLLVKRQNLVGPMVSGMQRAPDAEAPTLRPAPPWRLVVGLVLAVLVATALARDLKF